MTDNPIDIESSEPISDFWLSMAVLAICVFGTSAAWIAFPVITEGENPPISIIPFLFMIGGVLAMWAVTKGRYLSKYSGH